MRKFVNVLFGILFLTMIYMFGNLLFDFPLPKWYQDKIEKEAQLQMQNDPFFKLGNVTLKFRNEKDSLQRLLDSVRKNK